MFVSQLRYSTLLIAVSIGLLNSTLAHSEVETIRFGITSTESSQNQADQWQPFLDDMSNALGVDVEPFFATDYSAVIQAMRFNKIDIAWYGNKSAMEAVDRANGEIFAQTVSSDGDQGYWGLMIVHQDSPYNSIAEILEHANELTFGNGDPNSTSGFLVPGYYVFAENNVDPRTAFRRTLNSNHETNALTVANGQVDVATFSTDSMKRLEINHPDKADQLKIIWQSPLIPSDPLVWRSDLEQEIKNKLQQFILSYGETAAQREVLEPMNWSGFVASNNDQLLPIRQLELFREHSQISSDNSIDDETKQARLSDIETQLENLNNRIQSLSES
ncbi:phosphonate ABC transporter substrate-binding protein [Halomonas meridiana]|jgi:phosphonate transport system substrate-binding protein|uniref:phosphonate ABC transporter substrate-binding protein n=1 Tax=Vreelandella aquamarina TaxID=77097 RepID=UPI00273CA1E8|nr:phosphonate ABC transporter substrate-binding protein [Halomonas meridiana]MDP4557622.1 phosphonate ABC transporter substrate-binding protein [Halomonas meridiana]